jgi:predicted CXXCH cytochrome family protein
MGHALVVLLHLQVVSLRRPQRYAERHLIAGLVFCLVALGAGSDCMAAAEQSQVDQTKPRSETSSCQNDGCHSAIVDRKFMHGPVAQDKCLACHEYVDPQQHRLKLIDDGQGQCQGCHTLQQRDFTHEPAAKGQCVACHDPHGSEYRMMLVADPTRGLCVKCHQQESFAQKKFQHGPVAAGACILCHEPHSSWEPKLLTEQEDQLCQRCHIEVIGGDETLPQHVHEPVTKGCATCHDPHASDIRFQLHQDAPGLCLSCHEQMKEELKSAKVVHGALSEQGGCLQCHAPHTSALPKLQRTTQTKMCLSCHNKAITVEPDDKTSVPSASPRILPDMAAMFKANPVLHGPIREDACSACHRPHAGERRNMLVKEYPPQFYAPFTIERYALCFSCHRAELVLDPRGMGLTRFRKEEVNLHWLHVNRKKGRTCRTCHEVHASRHPFHIRDAVPFGASGWMLELHYKQTPTGGSCSPGCHDTRVYDHGQQPAAKPKGNPKPVEAPKSAGVP